MAPSHLTLVTFKGQNKGRSDCDALYRIGAELGHVTLLTTNRNSYKRTPMA